MLSTGFPQPCWQFSTDLTRKRFRGNVCAHVCARFVLSVRARMTTPPSRCSIVEWRSCAQDVPESLTTSMTQMSPRLSTQTKYRYAPSVVSPLPPRTPCRPVRSVNWRSRPPPARIAHTLVDPLRGRNVEDFVSATRKDVSPIRDWRQWTRFSPFRGQLPKAGARTEDDVLTVKGPNRAPFRTGVIGQLKWFSAVGGN